VKLGFVWQVLQWQGGWSRGDGSGCAWEDGGSGTDLEDELPARSSCWKSGGARDGDGGETTETGEAGFEKAEGMIRFWGGVRGGNARPNVLAATKQTGERLANGPAQFHGPGKQRFGTTKPQRKETRDRPHTLLPSCLWHN
jgi:hypothetical protein